MINLVIDIGNSSVKIAFFDQGEMKALYRNVTHEEIITHIATYLPQRAIICSVSQDAVPLQQLLQKRIKQVFVLDHLLPVPIFNHYQTPQTLGKDRLAAVCGAISLYPGQNCLVLDIGTCITYDYIDAEKNYAGGSISPGLHMRFKALHTFTSRLPLLEPVPDTPLTGANTQEAIWSGVIHGMAFEIEGMIAAYKNKSGIVYVLFCGGDALFFESKIKERIFVIPELVLIGLNRILQHNVSPI